MAEVIKHSTEIEEPPVPVEDDELGPEVIAELRRIIEQWRRGEVKWIPNEEVMRRMDAERGYVDD